MTRYCPPPSVTAARTFSISAGLDASTLTPGSTAPEVSRTVPVMTAWAIANCGRTNDAIKAATVRFSIDIPAPLPHYEDTPTRTPCAVESAVILGRYRAVRYTTILVAAIGSGETGPRHRASRRAAPAVRIGQEAIVKASVPAPSSPAPDNRTFEGLRARVSHHCSAGHG